jgi:hypothetical protein
MSVIVPPSVGDASWSDRILAALAETIAATGNNNASGTQGTVVVVLNPDHARALHGEGFSPDDIKAELIRRAVNPLGKVAYIRKGKQSRNAEAPVQAIGGPDRLLLVVAGGPGLYSLVMTPWGGGPHGNRHVAKEIVFYDACEVELAPA